MLVAVIFLLFLLILSLSVALPKVREDIQRDRDLETMHRGKQYIRAIQLYYRKFRSYPPNVDALVKTNEIRFLRKRYIDPTTGKDDWKPILFGQNKTPTGHGILWTAAGGGGGGRHRAERGKWADERHNPEATGGSSEHSVGGSNSFSGGSRRRQQLQSGGNVRIPAVGEPGQLTSGGTSRRHSSSGTEAAARRFDGTGSTVGPGGPGTGRRLAERESSAFRRPARSSPS